MDRANVVLQDLEANGPWNLDIGRRNRSIGADRSPVGGGRRGWTEEGKQKRKQGSGTDAIQRGNDGEATPGGDPCVAMAPVGGIAGSLAPPPTRIP
ncbi:MAG: hypothetical protein C4346_11600, partial [Chloroflexota bacterium]